MSISKEILEWSVTRPAWQRDALRRFVTRQAFVAADENEILAMPKFEFEFTRPMDRPTWVQSCPHKAISML